MNTPEVEYRGYANRTGTVALSHGVFIRKRLDLRIEGSSDLDMAERYLAEFERALEPLLAVRAEMLAELPALDEEIPESGAAAEVRRRVLEDVEVLETGAWMMGYRDARLQRFEGSPGILDLQGAIAEAKDVISGERALRAKQWPAPYRYTGRPGTMRIGGKALRRGDVVLLTRTQAEAWADKFVAENVTNEQLAADS